MLSCSMPCLQCLPTVCNALILPPPRCWPPHCSSLPPGPIHRGTSAPNLENQCMAVNMYLTGAVGHALPLFIQSRWERTTRELLHNQLLHKLERLSAAQPWGPEQQREWGRAAGDVEVLRALNPGRRRVAELYIVSYCIWVLAIPVALVDG